MVGNSLGVDKGAGIFSLLRSILHVIWGFAH